MNKQLIYDILFMVISLVNITFYFLVQSEKEDYEYIAAGVAGTFNIAWFALRMLKFRSSNNESFLLLLLLSIAILGRNVLFAEDRYRFNDIMLHLMAFQNQTHNRKFALAFVYTVSSGIKASVLSFETPTVILYFIVFLLMIQTVQAPTQTVWSSQRRLRPHGSFTHYYDKKDSADKSDVLSSPDVSKHYKHKEAVEALSSIEQLTQNPVVIIDKKAKTLAYNEAFLRACNVQVKENLRYILVTMRVRRVDSATMVLLKKHREKRKLKQSFMPQSSVAQSQTAKLQSCSTERPVYCIIDILQVIGPEHSSGQIIEFHADGFESDYILNVTWNNGLFILCFSNTRLRDELKMKLNTHDLMSKLFRSFSHEFSTSLNCIRILAEEASEELKKSESEKYIQPMINSCYILTSIVQDIRDYSMILSKNFYLCLRKTSIATIAEEAMKLFEKQLHMKGIKVTKNMDKVCIITDGSRIKQCLINLLSNAQKFTDKGQLTVTAKHELIGDSKYAKFSVIDSGTGIEESEQQRLQEFLSKGTKPRTSSRSFGIGLMISNRIARGLCPNSHGGIHFRSKVSQGSEFWFYAMDQPNQVHADQNSRQTIKYNRDTSQKSQVFDNIAQSPRGQKGPGSMAISKPTSYIHELESDEVSGEPSGSLGSERCSVTGQMEERSGRIVIPHETNELKKPNQQQPVEKQQSQTEYEILIVDDEFTNIYALKIMLERLGQRCDQASNGEEGFVQFTQRHHKLILMDIEMPRMNGIQATQKILKYCKIHKLTPPIIIAQSAYTDKGTQQQANEAGMMHFLQKPINTRELRELISKYL